ncbi:hypothetical protein GUITHDRAFT_106229 [Guillardia theta CCMP2712]|uniref:Uncharacterized protein n=1 Tax=Guillardia theta (strain CCMP2712) TaxID=905079 RepID=L1JHZ8_GUITC|nr:hypothetical protein GUITHDRAFT_106229 [Guillardia theta CCMP2712]EKX48153.1 hypothetical protein GUITHDRAFT_106229 [Guillardia theta CCMP2712]|eukprot:XP_005835133.1 hypothetical protein GUITHDRAFT_106229 [Guillardia theta CCMP2712]
MIFQILERPRPDLFSNAIIDKCFADYGAEDEVKACIEKLHGDKQSMDPASGGPKVLNNTYSMWHQPAQEWTVVGS